MLGLPFRVFASLTVALAGCGLSAVGPDLDAWQAHQAAKAALDGANGSATAAGGADGGADTVAGSGSDAGQDLANAALGDGPNADAGDTNAETLFDVADGTAEVVQNVDGAGEVAPDGADDSPDAAEVDAALPCQSDADCPPGPDKCHPASCASGGCAYAVVSCPPPADDCDLALCATLTGLCFSIVAPAGKPCNDNSPCTNQSACDSGGACSGKDNAGCDDGNACTLDQCVAGAGGLTCNSGPPDPKNCDDGNACTADSCATGACANQPMTGGEACTDGNLCTEGDFCAVGKCAAGTPKDCGPSTTCKPVSCDPTVGCAGPADGAPDGTECIKPGGVCSSGTCIQGWAPAIVTGPFHACAWGAGKTIGCWGSNKTVAVDQASVPDQAKPSFTSSNPAGVQWVAAGDGFTCRIHTGVQSVFCRGKNDHGQLGSPPGPPNAADVIVNLATDLTQVVAGDNHTCALATTGKAYCWGAGKDGQLGKSGQTSDTSTPVEVTFLGNFSVLAAGGNNTCGLADGEAYCWGSNAATEAWASPGPPTAKPGLPALVKVGKSFVALAVGENHACGRTKSGDVWCWGTNGNFQLGAASQLATEAKLPLGNLQSVAVGTDHTCVVSTAGAVSCFGSNSKLQKGPGSKALPDDPNLEFLQKAKSVSAAGNATCLLMANMSVQCFGVGPDGTPTLPYTVPGSVGLKLE